MKKLIILLLILPLFAGAQSDKSLSKSELKSIYTQAIGDFIKAANEKNKTGFDTLFFGKRIFNQSDDFPDITLPKTIENTPVRLISTESGAKKQKENLESIYINLIGFVDKASANFTFVIFSNGFKHQYDYVIDYTYNAKLKKFELKNIEFKGPPFK